MLMEPTVTFSASGVSWDSNLSARQRSENYKRLPSSHDGFG